MAKKKSVKSKGQRQTPSARKAGGGARKMRQSAGGKRRTAGARTPAGKTRRKQASKKAARPGKAKAGAAKTGRAKAKAKAKARTASRKTAGARKTRSTKASRKATSARRSATGGRAAKEARKGAKAAKKRAPGRGASATARRAGGTGRERELAQTPEAGRTVRGRTNPMKTVRSTGSPAGAGGSTAPGLNRERRRLRDLEESIEGPPSSLDMDRQPSAASSGRRHFRHTLDETNETGPVMTGGDVDADWGDAYAVGDEAPGGDNPTPDQDIVEDIGRALGVEYQDNEELKGADKIAERDRHRWELDPASSDDYNDRE